MTELTQVPSVDVRPRVSFPTSWVLQVSREILSILVRLDNVADSECVDVHLRMTDVERLGGEFTDEFGQGVAVYIRGRVISDRLYDANS